MVSSIRHHFIIAFFKKPARPFMFEIPIFVQFKMPDLASSVLYWLHVNH